MSNATEPTKPKFFLVYLDTKIHIDLLTMEERGMLFSALYNYAADEELPNFDEAPALKMAFSFLSAQIDRDFETYKKKCETNRKNARKGGAPKGNKNAEKNNRTVEKTTETTERLEKQPKQPKKKKSNNNITTFTGSSNIIINQKELTPQIAPLMAICEYNSFDELQEKNQCTDLELYKLKYKKETLQEALFENAKEKYYKLWSAQSKEYQGKKYLITSILLDLFPGNLSNAEHLKIGAVYKTLAYDFSDFLKWLSFGNTESYYSRDEIQKLWNSFESKSEKIVLKELFEICKNQKIDLQNYELDFCIEEKINSLIENFQKQELENNSE